jgi:small subunit ribosomal protein S16
MVRIKLVKIGKKNTPTWRVVVVEKAKTGKGRVCDYIGNYNPHTKPKQFKLDMEKYDKWIKNGAQPTDPIIRLKGNFIDKNKEYLKEVKGKIYKKKKPEEVKKEAPKAPAPTEAPETTEAPVEEVKEEKTEVAEVVEPEAEKVEEKAE